MKSFTNTVAFLFFLVFPALHADTFGSGANQFDIDFVTIGDSGNDPDDTTYGAVGYDYRIATYEVSEDMVDKANAAGGLLISKTSFGADKPLISVTWNEAARFVNWLNTSQGYAPAYKFAAQPGEVGYSPNTKIILWEAGDPGYDAANLFRNSLAFYFIASEDEWYKGAYYDPNHGGLGVGGYWEYPTGSDTEPTAVAGGTSPGTAVFGQGDRADIDNAGGLSPCGTMAQGGNAWEWVESAFTAPNDSVSEDRALRGGTFNSSSSSLAASNRQTLNPIFDFFSFRVASAVDSAGETIPRAVNLSKSGLSVTADILSNGGNVDVYRSINLQIWTGPIVRAVPPGFGMEIDSDAPVVRAFYTLVPEGDPSPQEDP